MEEKFTRERTGHRSNALFGLQKSSADQVDKVSEVLGPSIDNCHKEVMAFCDALNDTVLDDIVTNVPLPKPDSVVDNLFENSVSDDIPANIPLPDGENVVEHLSAKRTLNSVSRLYLESDCNMNWSNQVFNNCNTCCKKLEC